MNIMFGRAFSGSGAGLSAHPANSGEAAMDANSSFLFMFGEFRYGYFLL
jgi:hypothetical protein